MVGSFDGEIELKTVVIDSPTEAMWKTMLPMYVIYDHPTDCPDHCVIRRQWPGSNMIYIERHPLFVGEDVDVCREKLIEKYPHLVKFAADDPDPHIAEVWF